MLVQFMVKNVLSFKDETTLDMTAISAYKEHMCNLIDIGTKEKFVRVAAIYGANASGKSNLNVAMRCFQRIVAESLNNVGEDASSVLQECYVPFSFDSVKENSEFQIVEIVYDCEYRYGFEYNDESIVTEWCYRKNLKTNRTAIIFERTAESVAFGASVKKECSAYQEQIPPETLALTFFNKLKMKTNVFETVYSSIMDTLVVPSDFCENTAILETFLPQVIDREKDKFISFLNAIDSGIKDIEYDDSEKETKFFTYHLGKDEKIYPLNLYLESEGTLKGIALFIYARMALLSNRSIFVDELNSKLHPLLLKFIVDLFYAEKSTAQLLYTTHDTTLMDKKFFRRDQIWFVQKNAYGCSELFALSDFRVRPDASFEKDYLAGVYGGIPLLKDYEIKE